MFEIKKSIRINSKKQQIYKWLIKDLNLTKYVDSYGMDTKVKGQLRKAKILNISEDFIEYEQSSKNMFVITTIAMTNLFNNHTIVTYQEKFRANTIKNNASTRFSTFFFQFKLKLEIKKKLVLLKKSVEAQNV